jgi:hypothetical protein
VVAAVVVVVVVVVDATVARPAWFLRRYATASTTRQDTNTAARTGMLPARHSLPSAAADRLSHSSE